ncbi:MFS transporter [Laceyella putida]|uniref:MFS transporter n=1 Tax=Laceyella putida TaxID=110101 RepID=A0ABW2RFI6_9BACL
MAPWFGKRSDGFKGRRSIFVSTLVIASFLFALIPFNISFGIWLLILLGIQLTATVLTTVMDALASDIATQLSKKNVIMTLHSIATDLGAALGPLLLYFADSRFGVEGMYWGAAFILLLLSLRWWEPWRKNRQICGLIRK